MQLLTCEDSAPNALRRPIKIDHGNYRYLASAYNRPTRLRIWGKGWAGERGRVDVGGNHYYNYSGETLEACRIAK